MMYIITSETFVKIDSLQHLEISKYVIKFIPKCTSLGGMYDEH